MGYRLVITEKPSVAAAIAKVIGATERKDGYFQGSGYLVSWCVGHALPEGTKLPTIRELCAERKRLIEERKAEYEQYRPLRDQKKDFLRAKQNADMILRRQQEDRDERPREK